MNHSIDQRHRDSDLFGMLYGFSFRPGERGREIDSATATRIEHVDSALLAVVNDVVFNLSSMVSSDVSTLWVCARSRLIISARLQPLHSVDKLRSSVKAGECFRSPLELLVHLLRDQGEVLTQIVRKTSLSVDQIEDELLSSRLSTNRAELGANRRVLVRLQRLLALEPGSLLRLLNRPPQWLQKEDVGGVPLAGDPERFWILVTLVATFTLIAGRWAFRKRQDY